MYISINYEITPLSIKWFHSTQKYNYYKFWKLICIGCEKGYKFHPDSADNEICPLILIQN